MSSSFLHALDRPDLRPTDSAKFQVCLEEEIPINPDLLNSVTIDACVENLFGDVVKANSFNSHESLN